MRPSEGSHRDIPNSQANAMPIERPLLQATRTAAPGDGLVLTRKIDLDYLQHSSRAQPWDIDGNTQSELARPDLRHALKVVIVDVWLMGSIVDKILST